MRVVAIPMEVLMNQNDLQGRHDTKQLIDRCCCRLASKSFKLRENRHLASLSPPAMSARTLPSQFARIAAIGSFSAVHRRRDQTPWKPQDTDPCRTAPTSSKYSLTTIFAMLAVAIVTAGGPTFGRLLAADPVLYYAQEASGLNDGVYTINP